MDMTDKNILEKIFEVDGADACPMPGGALPKKLALAMAYVPFQPWETPYSTNRS